MAALARNDERLPWRSWVRVYRRGQQLRISLRDLLGFASLPEVWSECSALAEASLIFTARQLGVSEKLTTIALGKFGGCELGYGADLDVLFIGADSAAAASLVRETNEVTADGRIFPIDARLRPEGQSGPMAVSLEAWIDYFARGRGDLWEAQALTKARPVDGPQQEGWLEAAQKIWRERGRVPDLRKRVQGMLQRIAEHRGGDPMLDFKTGPGGLMQLEFYIQALQMHMGHWEPNTLTALDAVAPREAAAPLREACLFLRRVETILRRLHDAPVSRIPADAKEQERLARRCGFPDAVTFLQENRRMREQIARLARLS
jgi:glutamate-ammonia-ligase adenylyltransferase